MASLEDKYQRLLKKIALNLKRVRKSRGLGQQRMVEFGFDVRNYQQLESGEHSPSLFTLFKLADAFRVDMAEFFKDPR